MSSLPKTYKAWQANTKKEFELVEKELKDPEDGYILIKVIACGVCHSDMFAKEDLFGGGLPRVPGHEIVGDVVKVPASEKRWQTGTRVGTGWHGGHDGTCENCMTGFIQGCENATINGILRDGGYAEYAYIRTEAATEVSKDLDPYETAPLLCAGVTVFNGMRNVEGLRTGDLVAIQGIGGLGHLAIQFAAAMGYEVAALSSSESKKDLALKLGAKHYITGSPEDQAKKLKELGGAKVVVATAPSAKVIPPLVKGLKTLGTLLVLAVPEEPLPLDFGSMIGQGLTAKAWPSGAPNDWADTIKVARLHGVHTMVEHFDFENAPKAYEHMMSGKARFRAVLKVA